MRTITVTGRGAVMVTPDTASVSVSVSHRAPGVAEALAGCDSAARLAGEVAREHTDASWVASRHLHVGPDYDREGTPTGFRAEHSLRIGCPDLDAAGALVAALAERVGDRPAWPASSSVTSRRSPRATAATGSPRRPQMRGCCRRRWRSSRGRPRLALP